MSESNPADGRAGPTSGVARPRDQSCHRKLRHYPAVHNPFLRKLARRRAIHAPREQAAFAAGIEAARQMAWTTAMTIEPRDGSEIVWDQAGVAAL